MKRNLFGIMCSLAARGYFSWMSDTFYLRLQYKLALGKKLNIKDPQTFNEKIQWLKLNDRNDLYSYYVDKAIVKELVANAIGEEYVIPTLGIWNSFDEINFDDLPESFVLKCTHDSGGVVVCDDKSALDFKNARKKITKSLKRNYYWVGREWPYKNLKPRVMAEKYLEDYDTQELRDYKFFIFNGKAQFMFVATNRQKNKDTTFDFFDLDYNHMPVTNGHPFAEPYPKKPENFEKMIKLAEVLGADFPHVRVDFYECNHKVYFGEMTFYHNSGLVPFVPERYDHYFGSFINCRGYSK